ncbi:GNAT family N-acetyltransferase [Planococcus shenhongbingii]|uniref:Lipid II:glycine glycyltransferase n=1 Tax=Planococcus shenhongbingii TaxID=3058398 RepID=A0ABT8NAN6_9BACL|nr:GNAT family N-acetyltransferase [Planococcus sp. N017]MDN7244610.1 GNAT family N-acetyltransferase [Planococcus sp. N017]
MLDLYFEEDYGRLYENIEGGKCEVFELESSLGTVKHLFIKRKIPITIDGEFYYDAVTPYGYGGPLITESAGDKKGLAAQFEMAFQHYCNQQNIVSEFVRFHPILENALDFEECYQVEFKRNTILTNLADHEDPIVSEYSASCRRDIRHALKSGVTYKIIRNPSDLNPFIEIYHSTMKRNEADSIYYFNDDYFVKCIELFGENLIMVEISYEERVIGRSLNFVWGRMIHAHLTGTLQEFHHLAPAYVLQYALALWGKENGIDVIHHGGGRTGESNDKLYLFKKKFGRNKESLYYTGQKIWNEKVFNKLCQTVGATGKLDFHPFFWRNLQQDAVEIKE